MPHTVLLSRDTAPLDRLSLSRFLLEASFPAAALQPNGDEVLLYSLVGSVQVYCNGSFLGTLGGRRALDEPLVHAMRFPAWLPFEVTLTLVGTSADLLCATYTPPDDAIPSSLTPMHPYLHFNDTAWHRVGEGSYERRVAEVPTPAGFAIHAGETRNQLGGMSSWPPHANADDLQAFAAGETTWEEVMFFCCKEPGSVNLQGLYTGPTPVDTVCRVSNGDALVMPLGSHPITAAPGQALWYFWAYVGSALQKTYNQAATDQNVYQK